MSPVSKNQSKSIKKLIPESTLNLETIFADFFNVRYLNNFEL